MITFNKETNNMKTDSDDVQIIEEFEASKNVTEPITGHQIRDTSVSYIATRNSQISSEQDHSELL
jgi:hypothetical protein